MAMVRIVPALEPLEDGHPRLGPTRKAAAIQDLAFERGEEALGIALSYAPSVDPMDGITPASRQRLPNASLVYWPVSRGRRNTSSLL